MCSVKDCGWFAVVNGMCIEHAHEGHIHQPIDPRSCFECAPQINAWRHSIMANDEMIERI